MNTGIADLNLLGGTPITITGANASEFVVVTQPASPIAPGKSVTFQIVFDPNTTGLRSAIINITNSDPNENPYTFAIQGTGTMVGSAAVQAVKSSPDDSYQMVGDVLTYEIRVTNTGTVTLTGLSIDDPLTSDETCPVSTLAPSASTTCKASYVITFADLQAGSVSNTARIDTDQTPVQETNTVRIKLDPTYISTRTQRVIANFVSRRADQITASDPDLVNRLTACGGTTPFEVSGTGNIDNNQFSFATSLNQIANAQQAKKAKQHTELMGLGVVPGRPQPRDCLGFDLGQ